MLPSASLLTAYSLFPTVLIRLFDSARVVSPIIISGPFELSVSRISGTLAFEVAFITFCTSRPSSYPSFERDTTILYFDLPFDVTFIMLCFLAVEEAWAVEVTAVSSSEERPSAAEPPSSTGTVSIHSDHTSFVSLQPAAAKSIIPLNTRQTAL